MLWAIFTHGMIAWICFLWGSAFGLRGAEDMMANLEELQAARRSNMSGAYSMMLLLFLAYVVRRLVSGN